MKRLIIVGTLPETSYLGGVSIHVQRLLQSLDARGVDYSFCDYKSRGVMASCLYVVRRRGCVHLHISNPILLLLFVLCCKLSLSRCIFTLHGNYGRYSGVKRLCLEAALRLADVPVAINEASYEACRRVNANTRFIPVFIPPLAETTLTGDVLQIVAACKERRRPIVSTNASTYSTDKDGNDVYGIDFLVGYFSAHPEYTLLISDPKGAYRQQYPETADNVVFIAQPHSYYELLKQVDVFVRNTSTDGDALSVKEALSLNVPALCTDSVNRPSGVILFTYSDQESFALALEEAKKQPGTGSEYAANDVVDRLVELYF